MIKNLIVLKTNNISKDLGSSEEVEAFFSTISASLEPNGWGTKFPRLMRYLYQGDLPVAFASEALTEMTTVQREIAAFGPDAIVWDLHDPSATMPENFLPDPLPAEVMDCFRSKWDRRFIDIFYESLEFYSRRGRSMKILKESELYKLEPNTYLHRIILVRPEDGAEEDSD